MNKSILVYVTLCIALVSFVSAAKGNKAKHRFIVDSEWLANHLEDDNLVLLHVGSKKDFDEEHIPGAQYIATRDVSTTRKENKLMLELPPVERLKEVFEKRGISNKSRVVIYWGKDWITPTTRIFFTLDYLGLSKHVSILDGGMPGWVKAGNSVTDEVKEPAMGSLILKPRDLVAKQPELVEAILNNKPISIIDARAPKYYSGADKGSMPRSGRIPNAQNIPYTSFVDDDNMFKSLKDLQELFVKAGVKKNNPVVTYCHIGQQASLAYFAARMLGYKVRIYDGSFQEWSSSEEQVVVDQQK